MSPDLTLPRSNFTIFLKSCSLHWASTAAGNLEQLIHQRKPLFLDPQWNSRIYATADVFQARIARTLRVQEFVLSM